ncbi:MAG TPA: TraR/DksA C4-type zinc finger protein [Candidatus Paceibacterota bacterium]
MNQDLDIKKLKQQLEEERTLLTKELSGIARVNPKNPKDWEAVPAETDKAEFRDEAADRIEELEERQAETIPLEKRLENVNQALTRIATGIYGQCEICQTPIETPRLDANPAARTCKKHLDQESVR